MKNVLPLPGLLFFSLIFAACSVRPGSLAKLEKSGVPYPQRHASIILPNASAKKFSFQYLGCGGLYLIKDGEGILIDPFFSNVKMGRLGRSVLLGKQGQQVISSNYKMVETGWKAIQEASGNLQPDIKAIFSAHSHYDHLMDVPAIVRKIAAKPTVFLNASGFQTCYSVIDTSRMEILENHMTTREVFRKPIEIRSEKGKTILVYPILADHNPHFKNIKFFSGALTKPVEGFNDPYGKTKANDWLEGHTFSFLIDYLDANGAIDFRIFIQSSSCNPPYGVPPAILRDKPVDIAFLGIASYQFSPDYPCILMEAIKPREVVWVHWEDFFRSYTKAPKTVRGTNVVKFFDLPCLQPYRSTARIFWPGVKVNVEY